MIKSRAGNVGGTRRARMTGTRDQSPGWVPDFAMGVKVHKSAATRSGRKRRKHTRKRWFFGLNVEVAGMSEKFSRRPAVAPALKWQCRIFKLVCKKEGLTKSKN